MSATPGTRVDLTILATATDSNKLSALYDEGPLKTMLGAMVDCVIYGPAALTGTVKVYLAPKHAGTMKVLNVDGSDFEAPAAKAVRLPAAAFGDLQLISGSAEASDRVFTLAFQVATN
jgi:hypothetical protein